MKTILKSLLVDNDKKLAIQQKSVDHDMHKSKNITRTMRNQKNLSMASSKCFKKKRTNFKCKVDRTIWILGKTK